MVELVKTERRPSELAKELGCHEMSIASWVSRVDTGTASLSSLPPTLHDSDRADLMALRNET